MYCANCGAKLGDAQPKFCPNCGTPTAMSSDKPPVTRPKKKSEKSEPEVAAQVVHKGRSRSAPKILRTKETTRFDVLQWARKKLQLLPKRNVLLGGGVAVVVVALVIGGSFVPGLYAPLTSSQMPSYDSIYSDAEKAAVSKSICSKLTSLVPTEETLTEYQMRQDLVLDIGGSDEGRKMRTFGATVDWLKNSDTLGFYEEGVDRSISQRLSQLVQEVTIFGVGSANREALAEVWRADFETNVKQVCGILSLEKTIKQQLANYDRVISQAATTARNAPWYPAGYFDLGEIALKWVDRDKDCYSCYQWDAKVVSKNGCPSSVYVEVNILSGGTVVGWTNDTLSSLGAGQYGVLRFQSYIGGYGSLSASVSDYSCY